MQYFVMLRGVGTGEALKPGLHRKSELLLHRNFKYLGYMKGKFFGLHRKKAHSDAPVYAYFYLIVLRMNICSIKSR